MIQKKLLCGVFFLAAYACFPVRASEVTETFFKKETGPFATPFHTKTKRLSQRGLAGFDAKTDGFSAGYNIAFENGAVGAAYTVAKTDVSEKDGGPKKRIDTRAAVLSGLYKPSNVFFTGTAAFSRGKNKDKNTLRQTDVNVFSAQLSSGYEFENSSPMYGIRYVHGDNKGDGSKKTDIVTGVIAMRAAKTYETTDTLSLRPEFSLAVTYDFHTERNVVPVFLTNGAAYIADSPRLKRLGAELTAGVTAAFNKKLSFSAAYEGAARTAYQNHTVFLRASYAF